MSRYLTPSKIGILALAYLYTEGVVPTSETVAVLSFLILQILPDGSHPSSTASDFSHAVHASAFDTALSNRDSGIPGRSVYDLFLKKLWSLNCQDALDLFLSSTPALLAKSRDQLLRERESGEEDSEPGGRILRTSPLGAFIRRCHLEYTRLQFHDAMNLWQSFLAYRLPTRQAWEKKNAQDGRSSLDANFSDLNIDASHPLAQIMYGKLAIEDEDDTGLSTYDVEKLMEFQVSELQRLGGRLPEDMRTKLKQMSKSGTTMPSLSHYLRFLDSWRAGDYHSSFDNLHRYFDYTMQNRDRTFYQYALLNLAILQADFGCHREAIPAMQEAIATARENKDVTCLNFCMSWLYHFGKSFPEEMEEIRNSGILGTESEGLAFLKSRAKDSEMWSLLSTTLLSEAKLGLQNGDSVATAFENIAKASHLNVSKGIMNVIGPILLMRGSLYSRLGLGHLAWSSGQTFLECHADDAPAEDLLKCRCRMASLLVQKGRYAQATELMDSVPKHILRVLKYQQYWTFFARMLKLRRHLHRGDWFAAEYLLNLCHGQGVPDVELGFALSLLEIDLQIRRGEYADGLHLVEELAKTKTSHAEATDVYAQIRLLNVKARGFALCGHPVKGFSIAVRAANLALRARVLPGLWEAAGILANILINLHEFAAAIALLEAIVPQVFECEDCDLAGRTFGYLVDGYMGLAGQAEKGSMARKERMSKAMEYIDSALEQYKHVEDLRGQLDMLVKKATVLKLRGDLVLANDVASQYLGLKKEYEAERVEPG